MTTPPERAEQLPGLRRQLTTTLSTADELAFLQMLWTVNALQTGRADVAGRFLDAYPADAQQTASLAPTPSTRGNWRPSPTNF